MIFIFLNLKYIILEISLKLSYLQVVGLNFSSASTPELLMKTFDHYCAYRKTANGLTLAPIQVQKWLVLFCDEINLPDEDKFGMLVILLKKYFRKVWCSRTLKADV